MDAELIKLLDELVKHDDAYQKEYDDHKATNDISDNELDYILECEEDVKERLIAYWRKYRSS